MREAVPECFFHPAFQYGGCAVPEDWKLQHDNVGFQQALLLCVNINFSRDKGYQALQFQFREGIARLYQESFC